jgi:hypothetical protein
VATLGKGNKWRLMTGGEPMTEGRHYWEVEVELTKWGQDDEVGPRPEALHHQRHLPH